MKTPMTYLKLSLFGLIFFMSFSLWADGTVIKEREIEIKGKYLLIPISKKDHSSISPFKKIEKSTQQQLDILVDGVLIHTPNIFMAHKESEILFWGQLDVSEYIGKKATLRMGVLSEAAKKKIPKNSQALNLISSGNEPKGKVPVYSELNRPQLRFSQMRGWNNDTNGMVYYDGEYHLFWQANPVGLRHRNMYWGHAVSKDLIHWTELPETLRPNGQGTEKTHPSMAIGRCHSGGATVDINNTGGWQEGDNKVLLATFTDTGMKEGRKRVLEGFSESLAYSTDRGRTWKLYENNPIIQHLGRDPKIFWYEKGKHWTIATYNEDNNDKGISFYKSTDLKNWSKTGKLSNFFECPEIFEAAVDGDPNNKRWVMFGADGKYIIGDFDGKAMTPENDQKHRFIYGKVYAGQCFSNAPNGRNIYIGWARDVEMKDMPFNQGFTLPLEFTLHSTTEGTRMRANPVKEFNSLRSKELISVQNKVISSKENYTFEIPSDLADIELTFKPSPEAKDLTISFNDTKIYYNFETGETQPFKENKRKTETPAKVSLKDGILKIRLVIDRPICEIFFNDGEAYSLIEKTSGTIGSVTLKTDGILQDLKAYSLKSIWNKK